MSSSSTDRSSDRAVVIGCDAYPLLSNGDLKGAVRDALAIGDWLASPGGGGLPRSAITMLLSPSSAGAQPPDGSSDGPATRGRLARVLAELRSARGRRLYVYFAGHGCRTDRDHPATALDVVCLESFDPFDPGATSVGVQDLIARLRMLAFEQVVVIIDACRNFPYRESFDVCRLGREPVGPAKEAGLYVFQATAAGEVSTGTGDLDDIRGVFSRAVTSALLGTGSAKVFDDAQDPPYQVRWSSLCNYVADSLDRQDPSPLGAYDIVLATFQDGWFDDVALQIDARLGTDVPAPADDLSISVSYHQFYAADDGLCEVPGQNPASVHVPPRRQRIKATAPGLVGKASIDAYADATVRVVLAPPVDPVRRPGEAWALRSESLDRAALVVRTGDPADVIEILVPDGTVQRRELGGFRGELATGSYTVMRRRGAYWSDESRPVDLDDPDERVEIDFQPPSEDPVRDGSANWPGGLSAAGVLALHADASALPCESGAVLTETGRLRIVPIRSAGFETTRVDIAGQPLLVPVLPATLTTLAVDGDRLWVGLYDGQHLADQRSLALLDRLQQLVAANQPDAATTVRGALGPESSSLIADLLSGRADLPLDQLLAARTRVGEAYRLVGPGPWRVLAEPSD